MKPALFDDEASAEVAEAYVYYEGIADGLGDRMQEDLVRVLEHISQRPGTYALAARIDRSLGIRAAPLFGFPYSVVYVERPDRVRILAFASQRKRPRYWRGRIR